ncbi:MAG: ABC transporter permease [Planctomycetia bacterium]|nr:ABC transporter permease [Planctomycetia bacterium]
MSAPGPAPSAAPPAGPPGRSLLSDAMRRMRRNKLAVTGGVVLVLLVIACFALPALLGLDHETTAPKLHNQAPSASAPFGTDNLGRDYLARVLVGGQTSLLVGLIGAVVVVVIGAVYGAVSGYFGGWVDEVMMRVVDFLYGIPYMFLVVLIMLQFDDEDRGSNLPIFVALAAVQWLTMARIVRGQVLTLREREYVLAARVTGASHARILFRHVLPNCMGPIVVYGTLTVPAVILLESFLSYLGLGKSLSWGVLVAEGVQGINPVKMDWWLLAFPSGALALTLLSLNFLGDGLRDALDPRTRR